MDPQQAPQGAPQGAPQRAPQGAPQADPAQQLRDRIEQLGNISGRAGEVLANVRNLKREQVALHRAVLRVMQLLGRHADARAQLEQLVELAGQQLGTQDELVQQLQAILDTEPDSQSVNRAIADLSDALSNLGQGQIGLASPSDMEVPAAAAQRGQPPAGGSRRSKKRGGYKIRRDTASRTEVRSGSSTKRKSSKSKRTRTRRRRTSASAKKN